MDFDLINSLLQGGQDAYNNAGLLGALGATLTGSLRLYRTDLVQRILPKQLTWDALPATAKVLLPFLLSLGGAVLSAVGGGVPFVSALVQGLGVAVSAIGFHHGTKSLGHARFDAKVKRSPLHRPSVADRALSVILPIPKIPDDVEDSRP